MYEHKGGIFLLLRIVHKAVHVWAWEFRAFGSSVCIHIAISSIPVMIWRKICLLTTMLFVFRWHAPYGHVLACCCSCQMHACCQLFIHCFFFAGRPSAHDLLSLAWQMPIKWRLLHFLYVFAIIIFSGLCILFFKLFIPFLDWHLQATAVFIGTIALCLYVYMCRCI